MKRMIVLGAAVLMAMPVFAEEPAAPPAPNVDQVLSDLAKIGPDALVARVNELKAAIAAKEKEAADLAAQSEAKKKEAEALKAQVATIEGFTKAVTAAMAPPPEKPAEPAPAAEAKPEETAKAED